MVGTVEDAVAKRTRKAGDPLSELDQTIIGGACRIEIPFGDAYAMRQIADLLRGYAAQLDVYSRRTDLPERSILFHLRMEAKMLNAKLRKLAFNNSSRLSD